MKSQELDPTDSAHPQGSPESIAPATEGRTTRGTEVVYAAVVLVVGAILLATAI